MSWGSSVSFGLHLLDGKWYTIGIHWHLYQQSFLIICLQKKHKQMSMKKQKMAVWGASPLPMFL